MILTICQTRGQARKTFAQDPETTPTAPRPLVSVGDYAMTATVCAKERFVGGLPQLADLLERLDGDGHRFVLRGRPRLPGQWVARRYLARDDGVMPGFEAADRDWLMLDLDGYEGELPEPFAGAGRVVQLSASAGIKPGRRAHLWYQLDRPAGDRSLRAWLRRVKVGDPAVCSPVQPHYTARPAFRDCEDPFPTRIALISGPALVLPAEVVTGAEQARREREEAERRREEAVREMRRTTPGVYAWRVVERACRRIVEASEGARHDTIRDAIHATRQVVEDARVCAVEWRRQLTQAARRVLPERRWDEIERMF